MTPLGLGRSRSGLLAAPFVVGVGRSGTTLLRLMLDAHPALAIPPETQFAPDLIDLGSAGATGPQLVEHIVGSRNWADFGLDAGELRDRVDVLERADAPAVLRTFYGLYAAREGKSRWGDKTPGYVRSMRTIGRALGEARFVHLIRDGRDVALSRRRRGMGAGKPIGDTAALWRRRIEGARKQARRLRGRYLELRYEDLVADPEPALRAICGLCQLDFDPAMLAHSERAAGRLTELGHDLGDRGGRIPRAAEERLAAHRLAAQAATPERSGAWREEMDPTDVAEFERTAGPLLQELGYELSIPHE